MAQAPNSNVKAGRDSSATNGKGINNISTMNILGGYTPNESIMPLQTTVRNQKNGYDITASVLQ